MASRKTSSQATFAAYVVDIMSPLGDVTIRPMFGGYNVMVSGMTFALILGGVLYFKTDDTNRASFERAGLKAFSYAKATKTIVTSYFEAPDCLDDWDALEPWVDGALSVARRAKTRKSRKNAVATKPGAAEPAPKKATAKKKRAAVSAR